MIFIFRQYIIFRFSAKCVLTFTGTNLNNETKLFFKLATDDSCVKKKKKKSTIIFEEAKLSFLS